MNITQETACPPATPAAPAPRATRRHRPHRLRFPEATRDDGGFYKYLGFLAKPLSYLPDHDHRLSGVTRARWLAARRSARLLTGELRKSPPGESYGAVGGMALARLNRQHLVDHRGVVYFCHPHGQLLPVV